MNGFQNTGGAKEAKRNGGRPPPPAQACSHRYLVRWTITFDNVCLPSAVLETIRARSPMVRSAAELLFMLTRTEASPIEYIPSFLFESVKASSFLSAL